MVFTFSGSTEPVLPSDRYKNRTWPGIIDDLYNRFQDDLIALFNSDREEYRYDVSEKGNLCNYLLKVVCRFITDGIDFNNMTDSGVSLLLGNEGTPKQSKFYTTGVIYGFLQDFLELQFELGRERIQKYCPNEVVLQLESRILFPDMIYYIVGAIPARYIFYKIMMNNMDFMFLALDGKYEYNIVKDIVNIKNSNSSLLEMKFYKDIIQQFWEQNRFTHRILLNAFLEDDSVIDAVTNTIDTMKEWLNEKPGLSSKHCFRTVFLKASFPNWTNPENDAPMYSNIYLSDCLEILGKLTNNDHQICILTAAYEHGGRKWPSASHGSTCGIDIKLLAVPIYVCSEYTQMIKSYNRKSRHIDSYKEYIDDIVDNETFLNDEQVSHFLQEVCTSGNTRSDFITRLKNKISIHELPPTLYPIDENQFLKAVGFTQALLLTGANLIIMEDFVVMATAVGSIVSWLSSDSEFKDKAQETGEILRKRLWFKIDHFDHWHVDWVNPEIHSQLCQVPKYAKWYDATVQRLPKEVTTPVSSSEQMKRPVIVYSWKDAHVQENVMIEKVRNLLLKDANGDDRTCALTIEPINREKIVLDNIQIWLLNYWPRGLV